MSGSRIFSNFCLLFFQVRCHDFQYIALFPGPLIDLFRREGFSFVLYQAEEHGKLPRRQQHVYKNTYGRAEEVYECESCEGCQCKTKCCPKASGNRTIRMNQESTSSHQEVLKNLESVRGALLRMNRSIQVERTFGILKWDRSYLHILIKGSFYSPITC